MPDEITGQASTQVSSNTSWRNHSSAKLKKESLITSQNQKQESEITDYLNWVLLCILSPAKGHYNTSGHYTFSSLEWISCILDYKMIHCFCEQCENTLAMSNRY